MENSTKALLIAASVLIAIIIIALAIKLLVPTNSTIEAYNNVDEQITVKSDKVSKKVLALLGDLDNKNLINVPDLKVESTYYFKNYFPTNPKLLLEPDTEYVLSFNYKINYADHPVGCAIGYGETYYLYDIIYRINYPNQDEGMVVKTFKTPSAFSVDKPYLQLRFVRMEQNGKADVDISNVRFKKVK